MTTTQREPDERLWELDITACADGDILLKQGYCPECGDDICVRLHRSHLPLLAETAGWVTHNEAWRGVEQMRDKLTLLAAMVRAHCSEGHPLRAAADELVVCPTTPRAVASVSGEGDTSEASAPAESDEQPSLF